MTALVRNAKITKLLFDQVDCNVTYWQSELLAKDLSTGLQLVAPASEEANEGFWVSEPEYLEPLVVGSRKNAHVRFMAECCLVSLL